MKKYLFSLFVVLTFCFATNAQKKEEHKEKIKLLKISYLTEQLDLTALEAEKFWPIYNGHHKKLHGLMTKKYDAIKKELRIAKKIDNIDERKALDLFNLTQLLDRKKFEENQHYINKLKTVLPIKKILKLHIAEKEFSRVLMRKYRHKKHMSQQKKGSE